MQYTWTRGGGLTINHTPFLFVLSSQRLELVPRMVDHLFNAGARTAVKPHQSLVRTVTASNLDGTWCFHMSIFFHHSPQILSERVCILAYHWLTSSHPPHVKLQIKNNSNVSSGQPVLFLVRECSVCVCVHVWRRRSVCLRGGSRGGVCVGISILLILWVMCACACVCTYMPLCACLNGVQLQGSCSSAGCCDVIRPPLHCVFTPAWVRPLQLSLWGGVCVCTYSAKCEVFWTWIPSMPLPFQPYLEKVLCKFLSSWKQGWNCKECGEAWLWQAARMLIHWETTRRFTSALYL